MADVHKHALLAWMLTYLTQKDKPLTYIETHSGRALYDLQDAAAQKTGEADQGVLRIEERFPDAHPYKETLKNIRELHGPNSYAGSPLIAASLLRPQDKIQLAELHPGEFEALSYAMSAYGAKTYQRDGFDLALSLCPPTPRRGVILIDPSYELKQEYDAIPKHVRRISKAWNVGIICVWYPILKISQHQKMLRELSKDAPLGLRHEIGFPSARASHGMIGSGMFVINPPYGMHEEARKMDKILAD